jgi:Protein of unknown function (DUF2934)
MKTSGRKTVKTEKTSAPMAVKAPAGGKAQFTAPTHVEIAKRSYELYLARGGADGFDVEDWLQAESELRTT